MKKMSKTAKELKKHESMPASKAHKGLKTGGVVMGQGGYKAGGIIKSEKGKTMMHTAKVDHSPAKTGGVKMGNAGGYATGGVAKSNAGGYKKGGVAKKMMGGGMTYKKGGAPKKAFATGGVVNKSGAPVAMPQGRKSPSTPVNISRLSGTFKKGGEVSMTPAERALHSNYMAENASNVKAANAYTNEKYSKFSDMKMNGGGSASYQDQKTTERNQKAYENWEKSQTQENQQMRDAILNLPKRMMKGVTSLFSSTPPEGSITKTEKSVTVTPGKKRGGSVKC
jgi:hypothetical protein